MSATSPTQLSYDVFVSDGPAGAGDERMLDGAPLGVVAPGAPGLVRGGRSADRRPGGGGALALRGAGPGAEGQLPAPALIAASPSPWRAASPAACATRAFPDTGQLKEETLRGPATTARSAEKDFKTRTARDRRS